MTSFGATNGDVVQQYELLKKQAEGSTPKLRSCKTKRTSQHGLSSLSTVSDATVTNDDEYTTVTASSAEMSTDESDVKVLVAASPIVKMTLRSKGKLTSNKKAKLEETSGSLTTRKNTGDLTYKVVHTKEPTMYNNIEYARDMQLGKEITKLDVVKKNQSAKENFEAD